MGIYCPKSRSLNSANVRSVKIKFSALNTKGDQQTATQRIIHYWNIEPKGRKILYS